MPNTIPIRIKPAGAMALLRRGSAALFASLLALPAWAHHPMDGAVPTSAWEGLLSGLAHPVLGLDHLAFLIAAALLAAWSGISGWRGASLVLAFVGAGVLGTVLRQPDIALPFGETGVAYSLIAVALALLWRGRTAAVVTFVFALIAGGLHGWAYGEAVLGAEVAAVGAYAFSLVIAQAGLLVLSHRVGTWAMRARPGRVLLARRITAAVSAAVGLVAMTVALSV